MPHPIKIYHFPLRIKVGEQWKRCVHGLLPGIQRKSTIHANRNNLGIEILETTQFCLIAWQLSRTNPTKCIGNESKDNILFAAKIAEVPVFFIRRLEGKIRCHITDL